jgi:hypothetical protein
MAISESNFEGDREVFMVGQGNALVKQTEEEIARAVEVEISRAERLARNAEKSTGKRHITTILV